MADRKNPPKEAIVRTARQKLEDLFRQTGFVHETAVREEVRNGQGPDFVMELFTAAGSRLLLVETRPSGEPRLAREAVNSLLVQVKHWSRAWPVFAAPYIAGQAAQICRENGVGYADLAGNCRICLDNVHIEIRGCPNPYKNKRRLKSLSKPKSARIVRVLLNHPRRQWQTRELADEAGVSLGLVSNVKKILGDREWIDTSRRRITLSRPAELLAAWISETAPGDTMHYFHAPMDFIRAENNISRWCRQNGIRCAFTGMSGAVHLASGIDYYRGVHACICGGFDDSGKALGFEKSDPADANVVIIETADTGVFYGMRQVLPASRLLYCRPSEKTVKAIEAEIQVPMHIVSPVQVYFDLRVKLGKGEKEADQVYRQVIEPSW